MDNTPELIKIPLRFCYIQALLKETNERLIEQLPLMYDGKKEKVELLARDYAAISRLFTSERSEQGILLYAEGHKPQARDFSNTTNSKENDMENIPIPERALDRMLTTAFENYSVILQSGMTLSEAILDMKRAYCLAYQASHRIKTPRNLTPPASAVAPVPAPQCEQAHE